MLSFAVQALLVSAGAAMIQAGVVDGTVRPRGPLRTDANLKELAIIALLSFQAAGQIVSSRSLSVGEVPTVVITSLVCDLVSDPALFAGLTANEKRNRRLVAFVLTLVGAICGGCIAKASGVVELSCWIVAGIKLAIAVGCLFWPAAEEA